MLHLDANEYYGGESASLTLKELHSWAINHKAHPGGLYSHVSIRYPASDAPDAQTPPPELLRESRHYSISLTPALIPSKGILIDSLVKSGVSKYGGFRLLEGIALHSNEADPAIICVPASKEDVFKDKGMSLMEKRKLMKLLLWTVGQFEESQEIQGSPNASS